MPPRISRAGAGASTTPFEHDRQAYFGRRVTITRNWAGITSRRSDHRRGNGPPDRFLILLCLTDLVQIAATAADRCLRLDDFFDPRQMLGQRATIAIPGFGRTRFGWVNRLIFNMDRGNRRLNVFQRQCELIGSDLLGFAPENRLSEGCNQQFQPINPLLLALIPRPSHDQQRLQGIHVIGEIGSA